MHAAEHDEFEREIIRSIQRYFDGCNRAYATNERDLLHTVCAPEMVGFGTGAHEKARSRNEFEDTLFGPKEAPFEEIIFRLAWVQIDREGMMATAYAEVDGEILMKDERVEMPALRASFVFRYREPQSEDILPWQLVHLHYSFPDTQTPDENIDMRSLTEYNRQLEQKVVEKTNELREEKQKSENLLLNILPPVIAERLKEGESPIADRADDIVILFADIVNFTPLSSRLPADEVVQLLDEVFSRFDEIAERHGLEKIKTIGDAYMVVAGIPEPQENCLERAAEAALEMQAVMSGIGNNGPMSLRIGLNSGSAVAGVIGQKKFAYDLWGDAVNVAARMESHGVPDRIQCTDDVRHRLDGKYLFETRGQVEIKGKGLMTTHFLLGRSSDSVIHVTSLDAETAIN